MINFVMGEILFEPFVLHDGGSASYAKNLDSTVIWNGLILHFLLNFLLLNRMFRYLFFYSQ